MSAPFITGLSSGTTLKDSSAFFQLSSRYGEFLSAQLTELAYSLDCFYKLIQYFDQPEAESLAKTISDTNISDCHTIDKIPAVGIETLGSARCQAVVQPLPKADAGSQYQGTHSCRRMFRRPGPTQTCFDTRWEKAANDKEKLLQLCIAFYKKTISRNKRHLIKDAEGFIEITRDHENPGEVKKKKIVQLFRDIETERGKGGVFWKNYKDDVEADQEDVAGDFAQLTIDSLDEQQGEGLPEED